MEKLRERLAGGREGRVRRGGVEWVVACVGSVAPEEWRKRVLKGLKGLKGANTISRDNHMTLKRASRQFKFDTKHGTGARFNVAVFLFSI